MDPGSSTCVATFDGKDALAGLAEAEYARRGGEIIFAVYFHAVSPPLYRWERSCEPSKSVPVAGSTNLSMPWAASP